MLAHYCLHNFHITPLQFYEMTNEEKYFILASVEIEQEQMKKREKEMKSKSRARKR